jgi:hypothetical protein
VPHRIYNPGMHADPYRAQPHDFTAAIASIRTAQALNDRLAVLLRADTTHDGEQFSSVIGEARQLYPNIWSHLDQARNDLAQRGVSVERYDAIRADEIIDRGAILDVEITEQALSIRGGTEKTAYLNARGHALAKQGCNVLQASLPSVDWAALERADAEQLAAFGSLGPPLWQKVVFYSLAGAIALVAIVGYIFFKLRGNV